jgi:hypothetical protein
MTLIIMLAATAIVATLTSPSVTMRRQRVRND